MRSTPQTNTPTLTLKNSIVLDKPLTPEDIQELSTCEHFDIVIAHAPNHDLMHTLGDHTFILTQNADSTHYMTWHMSRKIVLTKPTWQSPNERFYAITSTYAEKTLYKPRKNEIVSWIKGINLWTFAKLKGIYPDKQTVHREIRRLSAYAHEDFMPWNMIVQGANIELIDWDDPNAPANMHNADACIAQLGEL